MNLFHRTPDLLQQLTKEKTELETRLAELQSELEFYRKQNQRIVQDAAPALRENAVLRYQLYKCQSDRQVLEFHVQGSRAEAMAALNLLKRLSPAAETSVDPLEAVLCFAHEARALVAFHVQQASGRETVILQALEARAQTLWQEHHVQPWTFDPWRWLALRASSLLQTLEHRRQQSVDEAERPADGLVAFDPGLGELANLLGELLQSLDQEASR